MANYTASINGHNFLNELIVMAKYNIVIFGHNYKVTKMHIVARDHEVSILEKILVSDKPEFVAVYGRRRVGKTFCNYSAP